MMLEALFQRNGFGPNFALLLMACMHALHYRNWHICGGVSGWLITLLYTKFEKHLNREAIVGWMTQIWRANAIWVVNTQHRHPNFTLIKPLNICTYENQWFSAKFATWHNDVFLVMTILRFSHSIKVRERH